MKLFLKSSRSGVNAVGEYDKSQKKFIVKKGSVVSSQIGYSEKFRGAASIAETREKYVVDGVVKSDVEFKSPSTAANFVTGNSTNGLVAWKDENGTKLKELL